MLARYNVGGVSGKVFLKNDIVTMARILIYCGASWFDFRFAISQL